MRHSLLVVLFSAITLVFSTVVNAAQWPQVIEGDEGTVTVYQPQPEKLKGKTLSGRAAMSIDLKDKEELIWGVFWFSADIETDRSADTASISHLQVTEVRWPDSEDSGEKRFSTFVEKELENSVFTTTITQLKATLAAADKAEESLLELKNDAPDIVFTDELAVLLSYDDQPKFQAMENSSYLRAVNTPLAVAANKKETEFYLTNGNAWYKADDALGPWQVTKNPPKDLAKLVRKEDKENAKDAKTPKIIVSTEPTELVATDGKPNWTSLVGGELMFVENTETPWLRDIGSGEMYVLLSGRWYKSKKQTGKWDFVRADKLPKSFSNIPPESELGGLRTSVAGTDEAKEAVMDAQIPQTAAVKRKDSTITVNYYEGKPKFEPIKGTELSYGVNTASQVLKYNKMYYVVEDAIWYAGHSPNGPWLVADEIPANEIAKIPPSSPAYNMTFVSIYGSTPDVVYVGYTSGYNWSYPYYGVPVYGTGWYYPPYWGSGFYYPYPRTWGMHVGYSPWGGWSFGVTWGGPFFSVGIGWGGYYSHGWYGGYHNHNNIVINNTGNINIGNSINVDKSKINNFKNNRSNNIYKDGRVKDKVAASSNLNGNKFKNTKFSDKANNVLADRDGNVVRKNQDKWQSMDGGKWKDIDSSNISRDQVKDRASNIARDNNISRDTIKNSGIDRSSIGSNRGGSIDRTSISNRASSVDRSSISNRASHSNINRSSMNRSSFNHRSMNRQFNARSRGSFGGGGLRGRR